MFIAAAQPVHYLPIGTTVLSAAFLCVLVRHYFFVHKGSHIAWWTLGILAYGLGTSLEASITLFGNSIVLNKSWYVAGAFFGGYPLAQGTVYLLLRPRLAHTLTAISFPVVIVGSALVILSPVNPELLDIYRPGGASLEWSWVRLITPFVNIYALVFLVGGAIVSAARYAKKTGAERRMYGNILIAMGALLPGIGGAMTKADVVEGLYVGEFLGLILIWAGYRLCVSVPREIAVIEPSSTAAS